MFCYQCEQTSKGTGCTQKGVCGKTHETAMLQDVLFLTTQNLSRYAYRLRQQGIKNRDFDRYAVEAMFTTVTNVNFDPQTISAMISKGIQLKHRAKELLPTLESPDASLDLQKTPFIEERIKSEGADVTGVKEMIAYGLKGLCAYADHAMVLGTENDEVYGFIHECLNFLSEKQSLGDCLTMALKTGEYNLKVMEILDDVHTNAFGHPVPTPVNINPVKGKCILVSGHDLKDLLALLQQTEGKGINIYTHGEMLPAHGYPGLKKYSHLVGNYGGAWQDQAKEFDQFPGAILMTTNCIQGPRASYQERIFTSGLVQWPGVRHIADTNFGPVIESALKAPGFPETATAKNITVGFGHHAVLSVADKVISAIKAGKIRHLYLIGGCDGAKSGRNYFTEFAEKVPKDNIILTLACGKYRFNKKEFGAIEGIPRLLDIGQCNDAYSAIKIASALAKAFKTDVNSLPLSLIISWYEQKAVAVLLSLLHLGIKNIRLGPSLPAFVTPSVLQVLVDKFAIKPIATAEEDLKATGA
jgi:hydroxylamine reductase